jgi:hypothetical protein
MRLPYQACFLLAGALWAQSPSGVITGTISDSQGASIPAVEVVARQTATGLEFRGRSSQAGTYAIPSLPIGAFELTASAPGFKSFRRADLVIEVGQRLRVDITLPVGDLKESVTVTGEASRVQTEDSALGSVVEKERIEQLPLNGRHVFNLVKLVAGVQPRLNSTDGFADNSNQAWSQIRFNGGPVYGNQFYMDGGMNTASVHFELAVVPSVDTVEEFKVETNSLKAEFGQTSGGVVNVVTKSGTNTLHGSLYEFLRNDALNARNAFATQRDSLTGRIKPVLRYNQYGGTVGGPVRIPGLYDGRNRTFFFGAYEQWRHRVADIRRGTVATAAERAGDFTNTRDASGRVLTIYDPASTRAAAAGGFNRDIFPGNVVPRSRMDPLSLRVLEYHPQANVQPDNAFTNLNNFLSLKSSPTDQGVTNIRLDHRFSGKDSIFGRYSVTRNTRVNYGNGLGVADPAARSDQRDNHNIVVSETHLFSPTVLHEFKANFTRQFLPFTHPSFDGNWPEKLGFPKILPQDQFPPVVIAGLLSISNPNFSAGKRTSQILQFSDNITIVRGRHNIKAGVDQRFLQLNWVNRLNPSGRFDFSGGLTNNPLAPAGTGIAMASFLLGEVGGGRHAYNSFFSFHNWTHGSYVQDDYKIRRRLTLNLGLRWDLVSGPRERWNRYSNFEPYTRSAETGLNGALTYAGTNRPERFVARDYRKFGPRFGFAWDVFGDGKTSVRGGYGLLYLMVEGGDTEPDTSNALGFSTETAFQPNGPFRAFRFSEGPSLLLAPLGPAGGPSAFRGQNVRVQVFDAPPPYVQQWNFTVQRALPGQWTATVSYAGNRGVKLFGANYDLNQLDPRNLALGLALQEQIPNPFAGQIRTGALSAARVSRSQLLRPFPDYLEVSTMANHGASSSYHSIQVTVERRYSNGLSAMLAFTGGKLINDSFSSAGSGGGNLAAPQADHRIGLYNRRLDRSLDRDDVSRRLVVSAVYELPYGPGKRWGSGANAFLRHAAGGWQMNTITTLQTGFPIIVRGANNFSGINWPDVIRDPTLPASERRVDRWFDTDAFRNPANFTIGNIPRTLPRTRGPGLVDVAFSLFKTVRIRERADLEFRAEAFNALNHVNYNQPNGTFTPNPQGVNANANLGRITSALDARAIQLGLRLAF